MKHSLHAGALHTATLLSALVEYGDAKSLYARDTTFDWSTITSSTNLSWAPCYDTFQCAKLTVPLQYSNPSAGEAQIALLMSPSNFSSTDKEYLGPILFNPGGPGGAGTSYVMTNEAYFREVIGPQYDLVGFDPRGIGETTPPLALFTSPAEALEFYSTYPLDVNASDIAFGTFYTKTQILGKLAMDRYEQVAQSAGTAAVATDMLGIARAFGREEVNYWGVSYGSVLGATFAAMYPQNVGRLLIDGVFNAHDWYQGNLSSSLLMTDASLTTVYEACVSAGPSKCPLYEPTAAQIRTRVDALISSVQRSPQVVYNSTDPSNILFGTVDASTLVLQLFQMLYEPESDAFSTFSALHAFEQGMPEPIFSTSVTAANDRLATCQFNASAPFVTGFLDTSAPIACGDIIGETEGVRTVEEAMADYQGMLDASSFATTWYPLSEGRCAGWNISAADRFNGTFETNTSNPILLISNTYDPVTPIVGGRNMSSGFTGSVLLEQNSTGHTSLSALSTCTAQAIGAYFVNGTLPAAGTVCQADTPIFESNATGLELRDDGERRKSWSKPVLPDAVRGVVRWV